MKHSATKARPIKKRYARPEPAYQALIDTLPLRPLRTEQDYDAAAEMLDTLAVRAEGSLQRGEQDYFDTLTLLVEAYDRDHVAPPKSCDPIEMLQHLMAESRLTQADLGRLLGNRALASLVLNRHRKLSKTHIRILADHFKVSPALFFEP